MPRRFFQGVQQVAPRSSRSNVRAEGAGRDEPPPAACFRAQRLPAAHIWAMTAGLFGLTMTLELSTLQRALLMVMAPAPPPPPPPTVCVPVHGCPGVPTSDVPAV